MNYRPKILFIFPLLLGLIFYGAMGFAQTQNATATVQSKSANHAGKTSSSNIHIDDIAIKISPDSQSGSSVISETDHNKFVSTLSHEVTEKVINWFFYGTIALFIILGTAIWSSISRIIENRVQKYTDKHIDSLDKERIESIKSTTKVTTEANTGIENIKKILEKLQDTGNTLQNKQNEFQSKIDNNIENKEKEIIGLAEKAESIKDNLSSITQNFESKTTDEIFRLEKKIKALKLIVNKIDKDRQAESQVIDELILNLNSDNEEVKYTATELLPKFDFESEKIVDAFVEILKNNPDETFELLLLIGLSELRGESNKILAYLNEAVDNLSNPNILAIIGALGNLGNLCKTKELESIVDKLLAILNDDLDHKEFAIEITASRIRGAIALALSCSGFEMVAEKAVPLLIKLLIDEDQEVRINAAIALGVIGKKAKKAKDAIPALRKLENDEYAEVRGAASESIEKIQQTA